MKTLDRYLLRQFFRIWLVCVIGVPFIFIIINLTEQIDNYLADDLTSGSILAHYVFQIPYYVLLSFPIAALLAAVFTVSTMTRHYEISAAKAGGVSFYRLVAPVLLVGMMISIIALGLTEVVPAANRKSEDALGETASQREGNRVSFIFRGEEGRYYYIRRLASGRGQIDDILIVREGSGYVYPSYDASASEARWDEERQRWVMESGRLRYFPEQDLTIEFQFEELWQRGFTETPAELLARAKGEEEMGYAELGRYIEAIERSGSKTGKLRVEQQLKLAFPFTCFIIVMFGLPLANSSRKGGASLSIGIALGTTILFLIMVRVAQAMGASDVIPPIAAAWLANVAFLIAGLFLFWRVKT